MHDLLEVQKYLRHHSFKNLEADHAVEVSFSKCRTKCALNYDMITAKENNQLASQCRGLILSKIDGSIFDADLDAIVGETIVQNYGFDRFLNFGQGYAAEIDWNDPSVKVLSKLDGTLTMLYFDTFKQAWFVSTRSVPEADLQVNGCDYTFTTLFEVGLKNATGLTFEKFTNNLNKDLTYCFELTSYYNRIVCHYPETSITLLGARSKTTFKELDLDQIELEVPKVVKFDLNSIEDVLTWVADQKPTEHEGVVIVNSKFERIKVKNPKYVIVHRFKSTIVASDRNALEAVLHGNYDDMIPLVPEEIVQKLENYKLKVGLFLKDYDTKYSEIVSSLEPNYSKKDFALKIQQSKLWETPLFLLNNNKIKNMRGFIDISKKFGSWNNAFLDKVLDVINQY